MRLAFKCEDVGADAVEEEAVVADDHGAAGEVDKGVLQGAEGFDVEVVGGLVEQKDIAAFFQQACAMCTRLRSPPERSETFFCWSPPLKLKEEQ